jgi:cellulose synthase/poly-beta-1,6-N-acetylglucosamine synthase-like glycosyltransferase
MRKLTIGIGIPAHNEGKNILHLLQQLVRQNQDTYLIKEIVVACDGCTDNTSTIVNKFARKYPFVTCIDDGKRVGKPSRLNYFFNHLQSDILVTIDADISLDSTDTLSFIATTFRNDPKVRLVGTYDKPSLPRNFFENIVVTWIHYWQEVTRPSNNWINPQNCHGCMIAMTKAHARRIQIPLYVQADDLYIFLKTQSLRAKFVFCKDAVVRFKAPNVLSDFIKQSRRFGNSGRNVEKMFPRVSLKNDVSLSKSPFVFAKYLVTHPITFPLAIILQVLIKRGMYTESQNTTGVWNTLASSK